MTDQNEPRSESLESLGIRKIARGFFEGQQSLDTKIARGADGVVSFPGRVLDLTPTSEGMCAYVLTDDLSPVYAEGYEYDPRRTPPATAKSSAIYCWGDRPLFEPFGEGVDSVFSRLQMRLGTGLHYTSGLATPLNGPALTAMAATLNMFYKAGANGLESNGLTQNGYETKNYPAFSELVEEQSCDSNGLCVTVKRPKLKIEKIVAGPTH